ncbi:MAG: DEAD/DEAH box helicase [Blastocatellia bacterium]
MKPEDKTNELAGQIIDRLAGRGLPPNIARLYSQHTRLRAGSPGLNWTESESLQRFDDAIKVLEAAFIRREADEGEWQDGVRRCGELLEWLSHPELNPEKLPLLLLAAAAYQIAGYPARASGLLADDPSDGESKILRSFFKGDFKSLFNFISHYWRKTLSEEPTDSLRRLNQKMVAETISALGVLCAELRWGGESRIAKALEKLDAVGKLILHSDEPYAWLLAKLCAETAGLYVDTSMRTQLAEYAMGFSDVGREALERYLRQGYMSGKALIWPSQIRGVQKLITNESFAFCTPTGSGKTTIAELGILQSIFQALQKQPDAAPLAMYMVPSRALATEVEAKLSRVLRRIGKEKPIQVTGLYGGTDWGPTDAWITINEPTVLICTYEKAEALIRFLGTLFIHRINLVVIDEAHSVQFDNNAQTLSAAENRSLRLEVLGARLFTILQDYNVRIIALSAVAFGGGAALAQWVTGQDESVPESVFYRSSRQLIGRLECLPDRRFEIHYDLLDGASLEFDVKKGASDRPYIPNPFSPFPPTPIYEGDAAGPQTSLYPYILWAALQMASKNEKGQRRAVLVSLTEKPENYCAAFLKLLDHWPAERLPEFFERPVEEDKLRLWTRCLLACEDYFTKDSYEYNLLSRGIVLHHGKMPGLLARALVELIEKRVVNVVVATSTLSEGVNLPFETVIIPSLNRWNGDLSEREFANLVGRAGRPGYSTEGRSLVVMNSSGKGGYSQKQKDDLYNSFLHSLAQRRANEQPEGQAQGALAQLIRLLHSQWQRLAGSANAEEFNRWLEQTIPLEGEETGDTADAHSTLDTLDSILLAVIVEAETLAASELPWPQLEKRLSQIWQRSFARVSNAREQELQAIFLKRGESLLTNIYPSAIVRRRLYRTSIPPKSGKQLLSLYETIRQHLERGTDYVNWNQAEQFDFIYETIQLVSSIPKFRMGAKVGRAIVPWKDVLLWWFAPDMATRKPKINTLSAWHKFISDNFLYRFNWGLGSVIALAIDHAHSGQLEKVTLEQWPATGLPWSVFWMKELVIWGTLDPVAAFALAKGMANTRQEAMTIAKSYYSDFAFDSSPNEKLNASMIRNWAGLQQAESEKPYLVNSFPIIKTTLLRNFGKKAQKLWRVLPVESEGKIFWFDPAGYALAVSERPSRWASGNFDEVDFLLDPSKLIINAKSYL